MEGIIEQMKQLVNEFELSNFTPAVDSILGWIEILVRIFVMVLLCVALVCMLSGGIGVMNVLLLSVRERKNEIGLIKAIGGTSSQIAVLFLLEAAAYAMLGGVIGLLLGMMMISLFGMFIGLHASTSITTVIPVLAGTAVMGIIFGVIPAVKAASLQPVEALRSE